MPKNENVEELIEQSLRQIAVVLSGRGPSTWVRQIIQEIDDHPANECTGNCGSPARAMIFEFKHVEYFSQKVTQLFPEFDESGLPVTYNEADSTQEEEYFAMWRRVEESIGTYVRG